MICYPFHYKDAQEGGEFVFKAFATFVLIIVVAFICAAGSQ